MNMGGQQRVYIFCLMAQIYIDMIYFNVFTEK